VTCIGARLFILTHSLLPTCRLSRAITYIETFHSYTYRWLKPGKVGFTLYVKINIEFKTQGIFIARRELVRKAGIHPDTHSDKYINIYKCPLPPRAHTHTHTQIIRKTEGMGRRERTIRNKSQAEIINLSNLDQKSWDNWLFKRDPQYQY